MPKLLILVGLAMAFALALPDSTEATSLNEVRKLTASDAQVRDEFGQSVAVSGDIAVVGAISEDSGGGGAGAAYVFQRNQGGTDNWDEVTKLLGSDAGADDRFGYSVAVSGDTVIVGAYLQNIGGIHAGAAYVFQRNHGGADNWGEVKKLVASDAEHGDYFGWSVAVSGDTSVIGALNENARGSQAGAAYVFQRDHGGADNWGEVKKLTASDAQVLDTFGESVTVSGDTVVVGADGADAGGRGAGAAYVFQRNTGGADNWGEITKLLASDAQAGDAFGRSVAISSNTTVVGANNAGNIGAAYVFQRDAGGAGNWGEVKKLAVPSPDAGTQFARSVAVSGDTVIVGYVDVARRYAGAAFVFQPNEGGAGNWGRAKTLTASDAQANDYFGRSVAVSGDTAVVGARWEDAGGTDAGAAYVFDLLLPKPTTGDVGDVNCDGTVDPIDAAFILQFSAGLLGALPCAGSADVNRDGITNPLDAALILQFSAGLLDSLPP